MKTCPPLTSVGRRSDGFTQYQDTIGINKPSYHTRNTPRRTVRYIQQYSEHTQRYLRPCSVTDACVAGVYLNCIAAGAPHCHVLLDPHDTPPHAHELCCDYDTE